MSREKENSSKNNLILNITDLDMAGKGIAHKNEQTFFVQNAIVGEEVEADILNIKKNIVNCKAFKILKESNFRATPLCPYFYDCGGCDLQHMNYEKTLEFKQKQIILLLKKIAGIEYNKPIEIVKSDLEYYYRNKISMQIKNYKSTAKLCYYKKNSHDDVFVENCYIANEKFKIVIDLVNKFLEENKIESFNVKTKQGYAKHMVGRIIDDKLLLTFVVTEPNFPSVNELYLKLKEHFKEVGINLNINKQNKDILSNNFKHLIGIKQIKFTSINISQCITNASFLQVNFNVQNKLYNFVLQNLNKNVVNAYSGAGLLTCLISKNLENKNYNNTNLEVKNNKVLNNEFKVIGIEINKEATRLANILAQENKAKNIENICGDVCEKLKEIKFEDYTLVLDPPRSGIDKSVINTILKQKPNKIVYISCSLNSLCKNLKDLLKEYEIEQIKGFDMFPQTRNLETVVVLKKIN